MGRQQNQTVSSDTLLRAKPVDEPFARMHRDLARTQGQRLRLWWGRFAQAAEARRFSAKAPCYLTEGFPGSPMLLHLCLTGA
jgi:hypothetical protein